MAMKINSTQRAMRIIRILSGNELEGLTLKSIADALREEKSNTTLWTLKQLEEEGVVEQMPSKHWRLATWIVQIAVSYQRNIQRSRQKIDELDQRYTRETY